MDSEQLAYIEGMSRRSTPRVLMVHGRYPGPNLWRVWWPCGFLSSKGYVADWVDYNRFDEQHGLLEGGRYNILITPRIAFSSERGYTQWSTFIKQLGLVWLYDTDDDLWSPEFPARQVKVFENFAEERKLSLSEYEIERQQRIFVIKRVDGVTVTTPHLADIASKYTDVPVYIQPNLINAAAFVAASRGRRRDIPPLTIGWSGTRRQEDDLERVAAAWRIVARNYPEVKFIVHGYHSPILCESVPAEQLVVMGGVTTDELPSILRNIDIACCSVSDDPWNAAKTPIKYFEATLAGSACVVSKNLYGPYVAHGTTGYVADTVAEWVGFLERLIGDSQRRWQMQRNAQEYVLANHSLQTHWFDIVKTWSQALDAKRRMSERHAPDTREERAAQAVA